MPRSNLKTERIKWENRIYQQKDSGKNISAWCRENQILTRSFFYWRAKLFPKEINRDCFTELVENKNSNIKLEYSGIFINLDENFNTEALKKCLKVLKEISC
jgi:hypothetical protein